MLGPRSYLYAPGDRPELMAKAVSAGADAVVFDLEDAVPATAKVWARREVARALAVANAAACGCMLVVRINPPNDDYWREDVAAVLASGVVRVRLLKVESAGEVVQVADLIALHEVQSGVVPGTVALECIIETARGVLSAAVIAAAHPRVRRLVFGSSDFARDIGARPGFAESELLMARSHLVLTSTAAGLEPPVDGVHTVIRDLEALEERCRRARALGFGGASAIHPTQIPVINRSFLPGVSEVAQAQAIVDVYEQAAAQGRGVATLPDGTFVDRPVADWARATLERAVRARG